MKTVNFLTLITASFILASCGGDVTTSNAASQDPLKLAEKRIKQRIEADAMGIIDELEILEIVPAGGNDSTFRATHSFLNIMIDKKVKLTRVYTLNAGLDSVIENQNLKSWMMSEGEWVETGW
jgi:hypothetical protein